MKKFVYLTLSFMFCLLAVLGAANNFNFKPISVFAEETEVDELNFVSLGDSVAAGHSLPDCDLNTQYGVGANIETEITNGCYTQLFRDNVLKKDYQKVNTVSYARSGITSGEFLDKLTKDNRVRNSIENADIITVHIGANDLLSVLGFDAAWDIAMYLAGINDNIVDELKAGIEKCSRNYPSIVNEINSLNPDAQVMFYTIFNPYREMKNTKGDGLHWISVPAEYAPSWYWDDWYAIPFAGGIFVDVGTVTENLLIDLNNIIKNSVKNINNPNYHVVDVKGEFDKGSYDYVHCDIVNKSKSMGGINTNNLNAHLDAHPTLKGQNAIFNVTKDFYKNNLSFLNLNYGGFSVNGKDKMLKVVNRNQKIDETMLPTFHGNGEYQLFGGWFKDEACTNKWDFSSDVITSNTSLFAKWSSLECSNEELLNQLINTTETTQFNIDVQGEIEWFVNGVKQEGITGGEFSFTPELGCLGEYNIQCKMGEEISNGFKIVVEYFVPTELEIKCDDLGENLYNLTINDANLANMDSEKIVWYKNGEDEDVEVGRGSVLQLENIDGCEVYAVHADNGNSKSNIINIDPKPFINIENPQIPSRNRSFWNDKINLIYLSVAVLIFGAVVLMFVASKIKKSIRKRKLNQLLKIK